MTKIIAKFSNGFEDEYKGDRAVKAAWMIVRNSDGKVVASGHSLDRERAAKTAKGKTAQMPATLGVDLPRFDVPKRVFGSYRYLYEEAAEYGFTGPFTISMYNRWATAKNAEQKAACDAAVTIEVVDL